MEKNFWEKSKKFFAKIEKNSRKNRKKIPGKLKIFSKNRKKILAIFEKNSKKNR